MPNVIEVKQNPKKPENAFIKLDDGTDAWCPSFEEAEKLVIGQPLPEGWEQSQGDFGPRIFPPKKPGGKGGGGGYRNSKEWLLQEQASIHRSVALEHAVRFVTNLTIAGEPSPTDVDPYFHHFVDLLTSGTAPAPASAATPSATKTPSTTVAPTDTGAADGVAEETRNPWAEAIGEGGPAQGECAHEHTTILKPDDVTPMPKGKVRCLDCGKAIPESIPA
jgi:hypothetical protein